MKIDIEELFKNLDQTVLDTQSARAGHEDRFLEKLNRQKGVTVLNKPKKTWWRGLSIAAMFLLTFNLVWQYAKTENSINHRIIEVAPEFAQTNLHFASLIETQVNQLTVKKNNNTKKLVEDALTQLKDLEKDFRTLELKLLNGDNSPLIINAMIQNYQTRLDLLKEVLSHIEMINQIKNEGYEKHTI